MKIEIKRWVKHWTPGIIVGESVNVSIKHTNPHEIIWPKDSYAFEIYEREDIIMGGKKFKGKPQRIGKLFYHPDSKIETIKQVMKNPNTGPCLVSNMKTNKWNRIIWTRWGNWPQPYNEKEMEILSK